MWYYISIEGRKMKKNRCAQTFDSKIMFLKSKNVPEKKKGEESKDE